MSEIETIKLVESNSLLPNLTICVEKDEIPDDTLPQIEYFDTDKVKVENVENRMETDVKLELGFSRKKIYENKRLQRFKELGLTAEEAERKKKQRAKRFNSDASKEILDEDNNLKDEKSESLKNGISKYNAILMENDPRYIRGDALFLQGVNHMNTDEIYSFFGDLNPSNIEWLNDASCNVVWYDRKNVIPAFAELTFPKTTKNDEFDAQMNTTNELMENDNDQVFENVLKSCKNSNKNLMIRFSEVGDVKILGAGKKSKYYRKYGNPHFGGAKGILTSTYKKRFQMKRTMNELENLNVFVNKKPRTNENIYEKEITNLETEDAELMFTSAKDLHDAVPFSQTEERYTTMVADKVSEIIDRAKHQSSITKSGDELRVTKSNSNILSRLGKKIEKPSRSTSNSEYAVLNRLPSNLQRRLGKKVETSYKNKSSRHSQESDDFINIKNIAQKSRSDTREIVDDSDSESLDLN